MIEDPGAMVDTLGLGLKGTVEGFFQIAWTLQDAFTKALFEGIVDV